jgi:8-oxo-dGTP diphosphatase
MDPEKPYGLTVRAVIYDESGRILLLKRSMRSMNYPGKWELPGGKVDPGERFDKAILREVKEETGLDGSIRRYIGSAVAILPHVNSIQLVMEVEATGVPVISHEHEALTWAMAGQILEMDLVGWLGPFLQAHHVID